MRKVGEEGTVTTSLTNLEKDSIANGHLGHACLATM
jgi:hypothetical protein